MKNAGTEALEDCEKGLNAGTKALETRFLLDFF